MFLWWLEWIQPMFIWYFAGIDLVYTIFLILGAYRIFQRYQEIAVEDLTPLIKSNSFPEVTFLIPSYNDDTLLVETIKNVTSLTYRYKKIVVVNDGSEDQTVPLVVETFDMVPIPKYYTDVLETQPVKTVYQSRKFSELFFIDKEHGTKFDTVNAGINACFTPFFILLDADTFVDDSSFQAFMRPLLTKKNILGSGSTVRLKNDCQVSLRGISTKGFPKNFLVAMQSLEYARSFIDRCGFDAIEGNFVLAGAFSAFPKDEIIKWGGFYPTVAEDMEIVVRIQRNNKREGEKFNLFYVPDPVAWTEGPTTLKSLGKQRTKWHYGLLETLWYHKALFFNPRYGLFGLFVYPYYLLGEAMEPVVELMGYVTILLAWYYGVLNVPLLILLLIVSYGFIFLFSITCLLVEEITFRKYPSFSTILKLIGSACIENFGYRQVNLMWRLRAFLVFFKNFRTIRRKSKQFNQQFKTATK